MNIVEEYANQFQWRSWEKVFDALPPVNGRSILDLGCGIGDQAAELSRRGGHVVGIDGNDEFIDFALSRNIENARFEVGNIASLQTVDELFDGVWASFVAAFFPKDFQETLACWKRNLRPSGWIALTEVDNMFGHQPVSPKTKALLDGYVEDALNKSRYDFWMGHKLAKCLAKAKFRLATSFTMFDAELSFDGAASAEVKRAWQNRFEKMTLLREFCGTEFENVVSDFVRGISRDDHTSTARVWCYIATK